MAGKITDLTQLPLSTRSTNMLEVVDVGGNASYKATPNFILGISGNPVGDTDSQTLSNKILTSPTISGPTLSGTVTGTYTLGGTPTFPSSVVTLTGSQTLTNKILTSPTLSAPTLTNASITADSITGFTSANNGTIYGVAVTAGVITSASVGTSSIVTGTQVVQKTQNPYKFSAYRNAAQNSGSTTFVTPIFDTKLFDTGSNYNSGTGIFTAPIAGFYYFSFGVTSAGATTRWAAGLYKNGTTDPANGVMRGADVAVSANPVNSNGSGLLQLAANDTIQVQIYSSTIVAIQTGIQATYFNGFLVSQT